MRCSGFNDPVVVCYDEYKSLVQQQLFEIGRCASVIILEPYHRGTAAAAALAAFCLKDSDVRMLVMPSDHIISDTDSFKNFIYKTSDFAENNMIVYGVQPLRAEAGYDYIVPQKDRHFEHSSVACRISSERDMRKIKDLIRGGALWNTGIFLVRPRVYLKSIERDVPELYRNVQRAFYAGEHDQGILNPQSDSFSKIPSMSIEQSVMNGALPMSACQMNLAWCNVDTWRRIVRLKIDGMMSCEDAKFLQSKR